MKSPFITLSRIAEIDGTHLKTVYRWALEGKIPGAQKVGSLWKVNAVKFAKARGLTVEEVTK